MPVDVSCPDPETLRHFASGRLPQTESIPITDHVRQCSICAQSLTTIQTGEARDCLEDDSAAPRHVPTIFEQVQPFRPSGDLQSAMGTPVNGINYSSAPT